MIADWSSLNTLTTPRGNLALNAASGARYLVLNEHSSGGADLRFTFDEIPQSDGQLNHPQYLTGYRMNLAIALWDEQNPACGEAAQEMLDELGLHIDALRNPAGTTRIIWTPENMASRMVNDINLSTKPAVTVSPRGDDQSIVAVTFQVVSEFPYEMSEAEGTPNELTGGTGLVSDTIDNVGNTRTWPVFRVYGPTNAFELHNLTTGESLYYDGSQAGAPMIGTSEYVEIDMMRTSVVMNGDVDDSAIAGIVWTTSAFWALDPGENDIALVGADTADILWNSAFL
jgi:hypothetical protein